MSPSTPSPRRRSRTEVSLAAGLLIAAVLATPVGTATAGTAPATRPLAVSTRCEGPDPVAVIEVDNTGEPELTFNVLENDIEVLAERLVARDGVQTESVDYPATGVGTIYSIETVEGYEVGRATLEDPAPDCSDDAVGLDQQRRCVDGVDLLEITITNYGAIDDTFDVVADGSPVREDLVVATGASTTFTIDWPRTTNVDPLLEVIAPDGTRLESQELLSGSVTPCGDEPTTVPAEPTDTAPIAEAAPAPVVAGAPSYTG